MLPIKRFIVSLLVTIKWIFVMSLPEAYGSISSDSNTVSESELKVALNNISERIRLGLPFDQVFAFRPQEVPPCIYEEYLYDATAKVCSRPVKQEHCADNMVFHPVPNTKGLGACACGGSYQNCFQRPHVLIANEKCYGIGTQGPCNVGETLVPISKFHAECGPDACFHNKPENALNVSEGSNRNFQYNPVFDFTYKGKCYRTESQAFCPSGKAIHFVPPYKIPVCIDSENAVCAGWIDPLTSINQLGVDRSCAPGTIANPIRRICLPISTFDFA